MIAPGALWRIVIGALALAAVGGSAWIFSLPNMAECRASGRAVDPTERYCLSGTGQQLLEEHAIFHTVPIVVIVVIILAVGYGVRLVIRRRRGHDAAAG